MAYRFGDFELDPRLGTLTGPHGPVALRRQGFRLCQLLVERAPELLDRDTLLDEVWGRTALSPNVLPQTMSELRQALGDDPQAPRYIETLESHASEGFASIQLEFTPGGDISTGGATVILAMGAGRRAAKAIDEFLTGVDPSD